MDPIHTRVGWAAFGDYWHFGLRMYGDLLGKTSYLGLVAFAATGRLLEAEEAVVLDDVAVCMHVPEPRIWPVKLARVAASNGNFVSGLVAGCAVLESDVVGARVAEKAAALLLDLEQVLRTRGDVPEVLDSFVDDLAVAPGLGAVHARPVDERVVALRTALVARGRADRPYWQLGEKLWRAAERKKRGQANVFGAVAAALLDLAFVPHEVAALVTVMFQPSFLAHAVEGARLRSPSLRQLPLEAVRYVGPPPRLSPRAHAAAAAAATSLDARRFG